MKYTVLALSILFASLTLQAQNYEKAMKKGLEKIEEAKSSEDMVSAANMFERIGMTESDAWLPAYYEAYCRVMASFMTSDATAKPALIEAAEKALATAREREGDASELGVIEGRIYQAKMDADPSSTMTNGPKSSAVLQAAVAKNPNNPRAALVLGENLMYTPEQFGGGKDSGCPLIERAMQLYGAEELESEIAPSWGKARAIEMWKICQGE